jgi:hypothetical protein
MLKDKSNGAAGAMPIFSHPPVQTWFPSMVDETSSTDYVSTLAGEVSVEDPIASADVTALESIYGAWVSSHVENSITYRIPFWKNEKINWTETIRSGIGSTIALFPQTSHVIGEFRPESYYVFAYDAWLKDWSKVGCDLCQSLISCQRTEPENVGAFQSAPWEYPAEATRVTNKP